VQSLGVAAIKYLVAAIILANWRTVFHDLNDASNQIALYIANSASAGDMFSSWLSQLKQQFQGETVSSLWRLILGAPAALITVMLIIGAYLVFAVAVVIFGFFYTLYGCILYVVGPLVLALLPIVGIGRLGANFATNLLIWNSWSILYALFGALITAIHVNDVNALFSNGFGGFFVGTVDSLVLGIVSIFYAVALMLIPKIAKSVISGDVGVTMYSLARAGAAAAATVVSLVAGASAGGASTSGSAAGAGASSGPGVGTGASAGAGSAGIRATSSSSPPPQPSLANTIRSGIRSVMDGDRGVSSSNGSSNGSSASTSRSGGRSGASTGPSSSTRASHQNQPQPFHRGNVMQTTAFHAARFTSEMIHKALATQNGDKGEEDDKGQGEFAGL
jgi:hypothetical protein